MTIGQIKSESVKNRAIINAAHYPKYELTTVKDVLTEPIYELFYYGETPEGYEFWDKLNQGIIPNIEELEPPDGTEFNPKMRFKKKTTDTLNWWDDLQNEFEVYMVDGELSSFSINGRLVATDVKVLKGLRKSLDSLFEKLGYGQ